MADEPYDMLPHKEIVNLKKQLKELREKKDKSFSFVNTPGLTIFSAIKSLLLTLTYNRFLCYS